jgi:hypothetical protein
MTPSAATELRVTKTVFDLDSRDDVTVVKIGTSTPVTTMAEFTARLNNDSAIILAVINDGLAAYDREQLAADETKTWQVESEDDKGATVYAPFAGTLLSEEKSKQLAVNVLSMAKMLFGYAKDMVKGDVKANRDAKKLAKEKAAEMLLSNPAVIEALKK